MELPADAQVAVDVLHLREPLELGEQCPHPRQLGGTDRGGADTGRESLEPEPRGVDLLEVLPRQPADDRSPGVADLDEPGALELRQAEADRRLRDTEALCELALDERRSFGEPPADDQLAQGVGN